MFNFVNGTPFNKKIESSLAAGQENKHQNQNQNQEEEKKYLEEDDQDEVQIGGRPVLTEDDVVYLVKEYIEKLKSENAENTKKIEKLNKYLSKFDVKKFMKQNPNMTVADLNMIMFNETANF